VQSGQADKGLKMMEPAIKAGGLKQSRKTPSCAWAKPTRRRQEAAAISTLKSVGGKDGTADLARYWIMAINHPM
jgi:hypothetical protein